MKNTLIILFLFSLNSCAYYFGPNRIAQHFENDNSFPQIEDQRQKTNQTDVCQNYPIVKYWASYELPDWQEKAKVQANRVVLAKIAADKDIFKVNNYLLNASPNATLGTKWRFNPNGDYDFTEIILAFILNKYGNNPKKLYPNVSRHIAQNLIISGGGEMHIKTPGTLKLMWETENHILMGISAQYLKNQWMYEYVSMSDKYNNIQNGVEDFLIDFLTDIKSGGFYEYNSDPYSGYSLTALLILHDQAKSETLKELSKEILDQTFYQYALSSLDFRMYPPMRRRLNRAFDQDLYRNPVNSIALTLYALAKDMPVNSDWVRHNLHQGLIATLSSYRLPDQVVSKLEGDKYSYFLKIGRGPNGAPEIYSGSDNYLLSAGGMRPNFTTQLAFRPTTLLLHDGSTMLYDLFYLESTRKEKNKNLTGVWKRFAIVDGLINIPENKKAFVSDENWSIFKEKNILIATYQNKKMALLAIFPEWRGDALNLLSEIKLANSEKHLAKYFVFPDSKDTVEFKLNSCRKKWMITKVNGNNTARKFLKWKRFELEK